MSKAANCSIPSDWTLTTLGTVSECTLGGTPSTDVPEYWNGEIPWMASGDVNLRRVHAVAGRITRAGLAASNATLIYPPAVAVGLAGQGKTRGTVALTLFTVCTNQSIAMLQGNSASLQTEFLFHNLDHRYEELRARSSGGGRGGLSKGILDVVPIKLPPLPEQYCISKILDTLDVAIGQTEAIIEKLKLVKQGLLHDLLTRGIDANGELRPPQSQAPHLYKDSPLGWIPNNWDALQFSVLARYTNGNTFDAGCWGSHGLPIIRIQNLNGSNSFNYFEGPVNSRWHVFPGDLLFAWSGQRGVSFGPRIWSGPEGVLNQHIFKVIEKKDVISKEFLFEILRFRQSVIEDSAHGFKDSFLHVTRGELGAVFAGIPSRDEQSMIVARIAAFESRLREECASLAKNVALKRGLMEDLLIGRVRVTPLLDILGS